MYYIHFEVDVKMLKCITTALKCQHFLRYVFYKYNHTWYDIKIVIIYYSTNCFEFEIT